MTNVEKLAQIKVSLEDFKLIGRLERDIFYERIMRGLKYFMVFPVVWVGYLWFFQSWLQPILLPVLLLCLIVWFVLYTRHNKERIAAKEKRIKDVLMAWGWDKISPYELLVDPSSKSKH
jgi:hypothetical protein